MPKNLKSYRIFIASPGGLQDERKAFRAELQNYNESEAIPRGALFIAAGWEDTLGGIGRPQSTINTDIQQCDYFLLLFWDRWGSPPGNSTDRYTSGTEEEYDVAMQCYAADAAPMRQIVIMFKAVDPKQLSDAGPQLQKVLEFKTRLENEKTHLFHTFDSLNSFQELLRRHLAQWLRDHEGGATEKVGKAPPLPDPVGEPGLLGHSDQPPSGLIPQGSLLSEAWRLANEGRLTEAEVAFSKAIFELAGGEPLINYGTFLIRQGRLDQATVMLEKAKDISEENGNENEMARVYRYLGRIFYTHGNMQSSEAMARKALALEEKLGQPEGMAGLYCDLGFLAEARGDLDEAEQMHRRALETNERLGRLTGMADAYGNLGNLLRIRGDLDGAEIMHRKSLEIEEKLGRVSGMASDYCNLGIVLIERGDLDGAEAMYRKALELEKKLGQLEGMAGVYGNLGNVLRARGDLEGAEEMHRKSLEIEERLGRPAGMASDYVNLGIVLLEQGDLEGAEQMVRHAVAIEEKLGRAEGLGNSYDQLGWILQQSGATEQAEEMWRKAVEIWTRLGLSDRVETSRQFLRLSGSNRPEVE